MLNENIDHMIDMLERLTLIEEEGAEFINIILCNEVRIFTVGHLFSANIVGELEKNKGRIQI